MDRLPEIANLLFQPLEIPGGWSVCVNHFYQLDPDDDLVGRELLHIGRESVSDPWDDVLFYYFDHSSLWLASRNDGRYQLDLEWSPMGNRNGQFVIQQSKSSPIVFSRPPKRTIKQKCDNVQIEYDLKPAVEWSGTPERTFESRDRKQTASMLNQWLAECSQDWS